MAKLRPLIVRSVFTVLISSSRKLTITTTFYCVLLFIHQCMPAPILHGDGCPTVGHLVHAIAPGGGCNGSIGSISNYPSSSAIYPQEMTCMFGLGGRLHCSAHQALWCSTRKMYDTTRSSHL